jgi:hypothetical protein
MGQAAQGLFCPRHGGLLRARYQTKGVRFPPRAQAEYHFSRRRGRLFLYLQSAHTLGAPAAPERGIPATDSGIEDERDDHRFALGLLIKILL